MRFGKLWKKYLFEVKRDNSDKFEVGLVGEGVRVLKTKTMKIPEGSIIVEFEDNEGIIFKSIFKNEEDAYKHLSVKKGGSSTVFYPNREKGFKEIPEEK